LPPCTTVLTNPSGSIVAAAADDMDNSVEHDLLDVGGVAMVWAKELWDEKADDPTTIDNSTKSAAKETRQFCIIEAIIVCMCCVLFCLFVDWW